MNRKELRGLRRTMKNHDFGQIIINSTDFSLDTEDKIMSELHKYCPNAKIASIRGKNVKTINC
jgi:hypothetical protein